MTYLRNSILATLVYYDAFDYPLTLIDIHKFLINPGRINCVNEGIGSIALSDLVSEIEKLVSSKILSEKNGFYFISGREGLYDKRIYRQKISDKKWKKFLRLSGWLRASPYMRGFFACGSMALGNAGPTSDFDIFVVSRSGRLYTSRFFLWLISSLLGARRKPSDNIAPDKLCFNHYISDGNMFLKYQSLYTAQLYSSLKPVFMPDNVFNDFFRANNWINKYLYNFSPQKDFVRRSVSNNFILNIIRYSLEFILNSRFGDFLENILRKYQQSKINKNPLTGQPGGRVVCSYDELEFHPHSFEATVIEKYNKGLDRLGIVPFSRESDSGLSG